MRILYDHQVFSINRFGGVGKYFCELIKNLPEEHTYNLSVVTSNNQHLKDNFSTFKKIYLPIPTSQTRMAGFLRTKNFSFNSWISKRNIQKGDFDIFHPTYFNPYFINFNKKPYIVTVHDLIAFKFQHLYKKESIIKNQSLIIDGASRIIAISENTKNDLIEILKVDPEKIDVIHHGFTPPDEAPKRNEYGRYLLYVAARWGYKNFMNLAKAFSQLIKEDKQLKLICIGPKFNEQESFNLKELGIYENCIAMGVSEKKLNTLYAHALAFVYPSLYEGFGMSILEAFANGCPVCLSNTSSLPEVAGNAGVYFDPESPESILFSIKKVIYDSDFASTVVKKGKQRLLAFSWKKCAISTAATYEKALSNR